LIGRHVKWQMWLLYPLGDQCHVVQIVVPAMETEPGRGPKTPVDVHRLQIHLVGLVTVDTEDSVFSR